MARMPILPQAVIPPEGLPPTPEPTEATASPTAMVLKYLQSRGYEPTTANVRRALEANARDPGVIPGLRSDVAATDAEDMAAMRGAGGGGGGASSNRSGGGLPIPPIPPNPERPDNNTPSNQTAGDPNTSAAPSGDMGPLGLSVLMGLPALAAGAAGYGATRNAGQRSLPGDTVAPPVDPGAGVPNAEVPPGPRDIIDYTTMQEGPTSPRAPDVAPITDMEMAMQRALATPDSPMVQGFAQQPSIQQLGMDTARSNVPVQTVPDDIPAMMPPRGQPRVQPRARARVRVS